MPKPLLIVVTGSPASGKTTLSKLLAEKIALPRLSRDELKEGLVNTFHSCDKQIQKTANEQIYHAFFQAVGLLLANSISMLAEAAFQHNLWNQKLSPLVNVADIKIIICHADLAITRSRFAARYLNDPGREKFHGDQSLSSEEFNSLTKDYQPVKLAVPTLLVDTSNGYTPSIYDIVSFIKSPR